MQAALTSGWNTSKLRSGARFWIFFLPFAVLLTVALVFQQEARTVDDLKTWSDESWDSTDDSLDPALPTTIRRLVKQELLNFHARAEMKETPHPATAKDAEARTRLVGGRLLGWFVGAIKVHKFLSWFF